MRLLCVICPSCFIPHRQDLACNTPSCQELQKSPTYLRDELEGQLVVARAMLAEGNTDADWAVAIREFEQELLKYDAHLGASAFTQ